MSRTPQDGRRIGPAVTECLYCRSERQQTFLDVGAQRGQRLDVIDELRPGHADGRQLAQPSVTRLKHEAILSNICSLCTLGRYSGTGCAPRTRRPFITPVGSPSRKATSPLTIVYS